MLCPNCFQEKGDVGRCPSCSFDEQADAPRSMLPYRTLLGNKFLTGRLLGDPSSFGLTYLAWDTVLDVHVAIKEYLPRETALRAQDKLNVVPHATKDAEIFAAGLDKFLAEARTLARFRHPNVVRVLNFFEENNTAYMVMDYYQGETLDRVGAKTGRFDEKHAIAILFPVLAGLAEVHANGFLHQDVKPGNIYLTVDGTPILLDFGGARQAVGERSHSMSMLFTPGYSPYEQHVSGGEVGPWSDVYAAGATLYFLLTGETPAEATARVKTDPLKSPHDLAGCSEALSQAVMKSMGVWPEDRYQDIDSFQAALQTHVGHEAWDVFICKKSTDQELANKVYRFLTDRGVRCFLSELAVPEVSEAEYQRVIDRAVDGCKHMILVVSAAEHVVSSWVEAEWRMFLNEKRSGRKTGNMVTVLAGNLSVSDLPVSLRSHQTVPLTDDGLKELYQFVSPEAGRPGQLPPAVAPAQDQSVQVQEPILRDKGPGRGTMRWLLAAGVLAILALAGVLFWPGGEPISEQGSEPPGQNESEAAGTATEEQTAEEQETSSWQAAVVQGDLAAYEDYLLNHPDGSHALEANQRIDSLQADQAQAEEEDEARAELEAEDTAWATMQENSTREQIEAFLQAFPEGPHAEQALARLADLQPPSTVKSMREGHVGWVNPDSMVVDKEYACWLLSDAPLSMERTDVAVIRVERTSQGYEVDLSGVDHIWDRSDVTGLDVVSVAAVSY